MKNPDLKSVVEIIHGYTKGKMSARPEFYSGRGVNSGDLNHNLLLMIHEGIKKELGEKQAEAFVEMLQVLTDLSATSFLNALFRLESNDWNFKVSLFNQKNDGMAFKGVDEDGGLSAMFTVMETMHRPKGQDAAYAEYMSATITQPFFAAIGVKSKRKPKSGYCDGYGSYR